MLVGRQSECERIDALLAAAGEERSGALLLRGEAGIGKTALVEHAVAGAAEMTVVRTLGIESDAQLEFSGLLEVCRPLLAWIDEVPGPQAAALRGAFGLSEGEAVDRFSVGAATLSLLAAAAERKPLLVIADDLQWLDRPSRDALLFAARRMQDDRVVFLFAARDAEEPFEAAGIEAFSLAGLAAGPAAELLAATSPGVVGDGVVTRLHEATGGNPLALRELVPLLSPAQLDGGEPLEAPLPAGPAIERAFARRTEVLGDDTRTGLLVAAISMTADLEPLRQALEALGVGLELAAAEDVGLIRLVDARVEFRHPLVRSAIFAAAAPSRVREIHRALAGALDDPAYAEQRAWHLAGAASGPDEEAAAALVAAAAAARQRSGYASSSLALERAARLTPQGEQRTQRLFEAADAAWLAGSAERSGVLVAEVLAVVNGPLRGPALRLRGGIEYFAGHPATASATLLEASDALGEDSTAAAVSAAADAVNASVPAADPELMLSAAERARALAPADGSAADFESSVALGYALCFNGRIGEGEPLVRHGAGLFAESEGVTAPLQVGRLAWALGALGRHEEAQAHVARGVTLARAAGAVAPLPYLLGASAWHRVHLGRWREAYADSVEVLDLAEQMGQPMARGQALSLLAWQEGLRGEEAACRERAEEAIAYAGERGLRLYELLAWLGLGLLEAGAGRWEAAIGPLQEAAEGMQRPGLYVGGLSAPLELAAAYARAERPEEAHSILDSFQRSELVALPLQAAMAARCRGLLASGEEIEEPFLAALDLHTHCDYPFEQARTRLAFGERLRRAGRRLDAREQLRAALAAFDRLGAPPWSARAREELDASGETRVRRDAERRDELTPRELQVAHEVAEGKSNKEAAAALFLSPKTIEHHLKRIYRKLEISSRGELIRQFAREEVGASS